MRISDWSSDVCSSDLLLPQPAAIGRVQQEKVARLPRRHHRLDRLGEDLGGVADGQFLYVRSQRLQGQRIAFNEGAMRRAARERFQPKRAGARAQVRNAKLLERSEEHTSELQSLM